MSATTWPCVARASALPTPAEMQTITIPVWIQCGTWDGAVCWNASIDYWYNNISKAARALAKNAAHSEIQNANNKYMGYIVAGFEYTLEGDTYAKGAFKVSSGQPEIQTNTGKWQNWATNRKRLAYLMFWPRTARPSPGHRSPILSWRQDTRMVLTFRDCGSFG